MEISSSVIAILHAWEFFSMQSIYVWFEGLFQVVMAEQEEEPKANPTSAGVDEGGESSSHHDDEIEEILVGLKLHGEEEVELDFSGELEDLVNDVHWLVLFRVHMTKPFRHVVLLKSMCIAWSPG